MAEQSTFDAVENIPITQLAALREGLLELRHHDVVTLLDELPANTAKALLGI